MQRDLLFWIWLAESLGPKNRDFRRLIMMYENAYEIFHADASELERIDQITERTKTVLSNKSLARATKIYEACERGQIGILAYGDRRYPNRLREITAPPIVLYYLGELPDFNERLCIGMVGTRNMSAYGMQTAYKIAYELTACGALVVSGMAAGIDGVAAAASIFAGGKTVAVLGCGPDVLYPKFHKKLMERIRQSGTVLSEYPPGTKPNYYHFPVRNRIISGLSQGTVVVEAGSKSGSLITARDAIAQGRDVFAVPSNVNSVGAQGTNELLREGANFVFETADILSHYRFLYSEQLDEPRLHPAVFNNEVMRELARLGVIELVRGGVSTQTDTVRVPTEKKERSAPAPNAEKRRETSRIEYTSEASVEPKTEASAVPSSILNTLSPVQLAVMQAIPDDRPVTADALCGLDFPQGEIIGALTMLEIYGVVRKLPGALYTKV